MKLTRVGVPGAKRPALIGYHHTAADAAGHSDSPCRGARWQVHLCRREFPRGLHEKNGLFRQRQPELRKKPPKYLKAGDIVELGIEGLGRLRQRLVEAHG
jgi:2-keto-4-pentenoate hydratase/2-oxohepta-3-ene-1,7-dioic acid hydratase in catechol pathway